MKNVYPFASKAKATAAPLSYSEATRLYGKRLEIMKQAEKLLSEGEIKKATSKLTEASAITSQLENVDYRF